MLIGVRPDPSSTWVTLPVQSTTRTVRQSGMGVAASAARRVREGAHGNRTTGSDTGDF